MMPYQKPHGRAAFKRLKCYIGVPKEFEGGKFEKIKAIGKQPVDFVTIEELSRSLGAKI
jgi:large subunit ribosomal protein L13